MALNDIPLNLQIAFYGKSNEDKDDEYEAGFAGKEDFDDQCNDTNWSSCRWEEKAQGKKVSIKP